MISLVVGYIEAYSQATCQPVKPLVRAHLRMAVNKPYCSGLQDRTSLRRHCCQCWVSAATALFRSPRPDFIETWFPWRRRYLEAPIVPVAKTGLH